MLDFVLHTRFKHRRSRRTSNIYKLLSKTQKRGPPFVFDLGFLDDRIADHAGSALKADMFQIMPKDVHEIQSFHLAWMPLFCCSALSSLVQAVECAAADELCRGADRSTESRRRLGESRPLLLRIQHIAKTYPPSTATSLKSTDHTRSLASTLVEAPVAAVTALQSLCRQVGCRDCCKPCALNAA